METSAVKGQGETWHLFRDAQEMTIQAKDQNAKDHPKYGFTRPWTVMK